MSPRSFSAGFIAAYLLWATAAGLGMRAAMPALNAFGTAYVGLTWPIPMLCTGLHLECSAVPPARYARWMFSFDEAKP